MNIHVYTEKYLQGLPFSVDAERSIGSIEKNFSQDFSTSGRGYFSLDDEKAIAEKAFLMLKHRLATCPAPLSSEDVRLCWNEVVTDFHRQNFWGFPTQPRKPVKELTEEQKTYRELWPYIWVVIQSSIILKTIVYFFGIRTSRDPSTENIVYLSLALGTSAGTLIFFAWRKSRK